MPWWLPSVVAAVALLLALGVLARIARAERARPWPTVARDSAGRVPVCTPAPPGKE